MIRPALCAAFCLLAAPLDAEEAVVTVTRQDCARLLRHVPAADVAYQPGIGVGGRKVAPADLPGSGAAAMGEVLPQVFEFPITVNPIHWAERNAAQKDKAAAEAAVVANEQARAQAEATLDSLAADNATLTATGADLAADLAVLTADHADAADALAVLQAEVDAGTRGQADPAYLAQRREVTASQALVDAKQAEIDAHAAALTANATAQAAQQAILDAAPGLDTARRMEALAAQATLSSLSSRGLDETTMAVGTVAYDIRIGGFTFNGRPLGSAEQAALAEACARQGVR